MLLSMQNGHLGRAVDVPAPDEERQHRRAVL
jgi:hypothetical protein